MTIDGTLESPLPIRMSFWKKEIDMVYAKTGRLKIFFKFKPAVISGQISLEPRQQAIVHLNKDARLLQASCYFVH